MADIADRSPDDALAGAYSLSPAGDAYDLVVTESILQFLREPVSVLDAIRRVAARSA